MITTQKSPLAALHARRGAAPTIIGADTIAHAMLESPGDIQIEGRVEGGVRAAHLIVGDRAVVLGEIAAETVIVRGSVQGTIWAGSVTICAGAHVEGNVRCETFTVESGAHLACSHFHAAEPSGSRGETGTNGSGTAQELLEMSPDAELDTAPLTAAV
jgi:cytoskeletal protein CcmA (bactofilin family)